MATVHEVKKVTKDLVEFETVEENEDEIKECFQYIREYFSGEEFVIQEFEENGVETLVVGFKETTNPEVLLHGHVDVVPAEAEMFDPEIDGDRIYGRGTGDMKSGVASLMKVMKDMREEAPDVALMLVSDEEKGGFNGARYMIEEVGFDAGFAISAEPNNTSNYMDIVVEQKGLVKATLEVEGRSAHASKPWKGINAAEKIMRIYREDIKPMFPDNSEKTWSTTVNLGSIEAGDVSNKVADHARMKLDIRWSEEFPPEEIRDELESVEGIEVSEFSWDPMLETDPEDDYVQGLKTCCEEVGFEPEVTRKEPASDMKHFSRAGIPAVVFGPEAYNSHEPDENAVVSSFEDYTNSVKRFLRSTAV